MVALGRRALKQQQADDYIAELVKRLNPGEALPPIRKLMQDSGFGRNILEHSIVRYADENILTIKDRSGVYRTEQGISCPEGTVVDLVACSEIGYMDDPTLFVGDLVNCLLAEGSRLNYSIRIHRVSYYSEVTMYKELIEQQNIRNAMLLLPHHDDIPKIFEKAGVRHVVLCPRYYPSNGYSVLGDLGDAEQEMAYLIERGHRRIGLIHTVDLGFHSLEDSCRREEYYRIMAEHGFRVDPRWVIHYSFDEKVMEERLESMLQCESLPTAMLICDHFAVPVYNFFKSHHLTIGRDISLISKGGFLRTRLTPTLTTAVQSRKKIARLAWNIFQEIGGRYQAPVVELCETELKEGESVAMLADC